jgi:hypothetical protein
MNFLDTGGTGLLRSRFVPDIAGHSETTITRNKFPTIEVAELNEIPIRGVKFFNYPTPQDHCIMIYTTEEEYVAYSQNCTHLSCPVYYSAKMTGWNVRASKAFSQ